ncbi:MAG: polyphosphate--glucose phosphotransferase [Acidimicrobiales bacterium]
MTASFGVDIGGTGIKAAPVDLTEGRLTAERVRVKTPKPATPDAVAEVVAELVAGFGWQGAVGCTFPGVVKAGHAMTAANVDKRWIGVNADALFTKRLDLDVHLLNDADAAGLAEVRYGAARGRTGVVFMLTIGTGLGSGLFVDGLLVPNTELGHIELDGQDAEDLAAESTRIEQKLSWKHWAARLDDYLARIEAYLNPDLIILGGGGAKKADKFVPLLRRHTEIVTAALGNAAGIVGAAMAAAANP